MKIQHKNRRTESIQEVSHAVYKADAIRLDEPTEWEVWALLRHRYLESRGAYRPPLEYVSDWRIVGVGRSLLSGDMDVTFKRATFTHTKTLHRTIFDSRSLNDPARWPIAGAVLSGEPTPTPVWGE